MPDQDYMERPGRRVNKSLAATVVAGSSTKMLTVNVRGLERLFVHLTVAVAALTGFAIKVTATPGATAASLYSTSGAFTSPTGLLLGADADLTGAATGAHWLILDVKGLETVELWATSGGTATLAAEAGGA